MPKLLKACILATSDLNQLNVWSKLRTMITYHDLPTTVDEYQVPLFYFYVELLE